MAACPTPSKDAHETRGTAVVSAAHAVCKRGGYIRVYLCPCGAWHLTHKVRPGS